VRQTLRGLLFPFTLVLVALQLLSAGTPERDWTHFVRIGAYGLHAGNVDEIVRDATNSNVFGIEVDNDIPGRYESFLDPTQKLKDIRALAAKAHQAGNKAFVYIAGTECITANADKAAHSMAKDHPDWLQRKRSGEPAVFTAGAAFWISPGDEDVWISPYATEWRKLYMQRVREIAATGIDGIYVDIPYWMTHFDGWEDSWASFDDYTVAAFRKRTGLDARTLKLGDFNDPDFRKWIDFRIETLTEFMREIDENAKSVNPAIKTIPEIYPGIEQEAVRVGADVYDMYRVVDAIAHEYEYGGGDHTATARTQPDWFFYQVGMHAFRAFAEGKPTWILNYSWDGDKKIAPSDAMQNLAMSQVMVGANFWDAKGHSMSNSNDMAMRTRIFDWIRRNEDHLYSQRVPIDPVGIYFSPATRNYFAEEFIRSFRGITALLIQKHWEFQVVTPRTLGQFRGKSLVLPDVRILTDAELSALRTFVDRGGTLVATGEASVPALGPKVNRFPQCPGKDYIDNMLRNFSATTPDSERVFLEALRHSTSISIEASPAVATSIASVNGKPHFYFANFKGLRSGENAIPTPELNAQISVKRGTKGVLHVVPFMGVEMRIPGVPKGDAITYVIPRIDRGAVAWIDAR
jgi:hypothetical protein